MGLRPMARIDDQHNSRRSGSSDPSEGLNVTDLLVLPDRQRSVVRFLIRQPRKSEAEIAEHLQESLEQITPLLQELIQSGYIALDENLYIPKLGRRSPQVQPKRRSAKVAAVWDKLG